MNLTNDKVFSFIGLATRARKLVSGEFSTEKAIKEKKAKIVIIATDASENTKKKFRNSCLFYQLEYFEYGTKEELGQCMGKEARASLAVLDEGMANEIIKYLKR